MKIGRYFFKSISFSSQKYFVNLHFSLLKAALLSRGSMWSRSMFVTLPWIESDRPFFLNFYSARRTIPSMNWKRIKPLSGTNTFPLYSAPEIEFVVMKVKSVIFKGVSFEMIFASWQNSVNELFETAQMSPKGLHEE